MVKCGVQFSLKCLSFTSVHCDMLSLVFVPSLAMLSMEGSGVSSHPRAVLQVEWMDVLRPRCRLDGIPIGVMML